MPGLDGLVTIQRLHAEFPEVRVLILCLNDHALAMLYQAATNEAVRQQLFEERLQEGAVYFDRIKALVTTFRFGL